jgi:hypothetical protein
MTAFKMTLRDPQRAERATRRPLCPPCLRHGEQEECSSVRRTILSRPLVVKTRRFALGLMVSAVSAVCACGSPEAPYGPVAPVAEWHEFHGTWTATGSRHSIGLGDERRASIATYNGSLLLAGASRPGVGFRAEAIVLNDTATGMVGRSVWTDEHGDQVYSELKGEGTATGNRIAGTFLGGTGRYSGATGTYEFSWQFLLETEDGTVQGQSLGLRGRVYLGGAQAKPGAGGTRP